MTPDAFPGGLAELAFVEAYWRSALRKPQIAADTALRSLVFADLADRALLTGLIGQELAEACRRLVAVHDALADRTYNVARSLMRPLPGLDEWRQFVRQAAAYTPEQMLRELSLDSSAMPSAINLRSQDGLGQLNGLVAAAAGGSAMLLVPRPAKNADTECWYAGITSDGPPVAASFGTDEIDAANLADLTADLSSIARGFLGAYLESRRNAGWRGER
jgi:hypothetical protein